MTKLVPANLYCVKMARKYESQSSGATVLVNAASADEAREAVIGTPEIVGLFDNQVHPPLIFVEKADIFHVRTAPSIGSLVAQLRSESVQRLQK